MDQDTAERTLGDLAGRPESGRSIRDRRLHERSDEVLVRTWSVAFPQGAERESIGAIVALADSLGLAQRWDMGTKDYAKLPHLQHFERPT